jgi:acyl-CoA dehydrogenase
MTREAMAARGERVRRTIFTEEHTAFRSRVRDFVDEQVRPNYVSWEGQGHVPRDLYHQLGEIGAMGINIPEEFGGGGRDDYLYNVVLQEEAARALVTLGTLRSHLDVVVPYFLDYANDEQQRRWFPGFATGDLYTAISLTEPDTGSDVAGVTTSAQRDGDEYVLNGAKTFVTGGFHADLIIVLARTAPVAGDRREGLSLIVVEADMPGVTKGPLLEKLGLKTQDTVELSFSDVRVPVRNLLGEEGKAFSYLGHNLAGERLALSVGSVSQARAAIALTVAHASRRQVGGMTLGRHQNTRFELAAAETEVDAAQALVDRALEANATAELTPADAAKVKLFASEVQGRTLDRCMQLFGGHSYLAESPIARLYLDGRVSRIYGGTSEVMKLVIGKAMGL